MTDTKREDFKREFAALMRKYRVTVQVMTESRSYETYVSGVDFDFDGYYDENGDYQWSQTVTVGAYFDADDVEKAK